MRGVLSRLVKQALTPQGLQVQAIRPFHSYAAAVLKPGTPDKYLENLHKTGFIDGNPNVLKIATLPEFSLNGDAIGGLTPIARTEYEQTRDMLVKQAQALPKGALFCMGTVAVNTGQLTEAGQKIGVNRGCVIATGTGEFLEWDKQSVSSVDHWPRDYEVQTGAKEAAIIVKRLMETGRDVVISLRTCLDIKAPPSFDIQPDLIISPAFGSPLQAETVRASYRDGVVLLCDNGNGDLNDLIENRQEVIIDSDKGIDTYIKSGLWDVVQKDIGKYSFLRPTNPLGNMLSTWLNSFVPSLNKYREIADVYAKSISFGEYHPEYGIAVTTDRQLKDLTKEQYAARRLFADFTVFYDSDIPDRTAEQLKELSRSIQWDSLESEVNTFIKDYVDSKLNQQDALSRRTQDWIAELNGNVFQCEVLDRMNLKVLELLVSTGDERLNEIAEAYKDKLNQLVQETISNDVFKRISEGTAEASYLGELLHSHVLAAQTHALSEKISETQQELVEDTSRIEETNRELQRRYEDAERVRQALERRKDDRELLDRKELLEKEISELKRKAQELEKKSEDIRREERDRHKDLEDKQKERKEAEKRAKEKRARIFEVK
ncbi:hypothetical protein [Cohnella panacarvi]|uniref:hypothetical protein n=1 Tax=Cohnella panacarvi TaxID=400776 RepID=UPI00047BD03C|nr:hypothetical protein [Cohnella panacarvi]